MAPRSFGASLHDKRYGNDARSVVTSAEQSRGMSAQDKSQELRGGANFSVPDEHDFSRPSPRGNIAANFKPYLLEPEVPATDLWNALGTWKIRHIR